MTYGNSADLKVLYTAVADSVSSDLETLALKGADRWVDQKLLGTTVSTTPTPPLIQQAATYYAYVLILRNLNDTYVNEQPEYDKWEKMANDLIDAYISAAHIDSSENPYSSRKTPTQSFMERDVRTEEDPNEFEHDDVIYEWDQER